MTALYYEKAEREYNKQNEKVKFEHLMKNESLENNNPNELLIHIYFEENTEFQNNFNDVDEG